MFGRAEVQLADCLHEVRPLANSFPYIMMQWRHPQDLECRWKVVSQHVDDDNDRHDFNGYDGGLFPMADFVGSVCVEVEDQGIGISEHKRGLIFRPYVQIDPETVQGGKGTGLGLAICASILDGIKGRYGFDSSVGQGSTFWFEWPFGVSKILKTNATNGNSEPIRILVVDDDLNSTLIMGKVLDRLKVVHETLHDGKDAVELFSTFTPDNPNRYDALFIETIRWLRAHGWNIPIVSMTATADDEDRQHLKEAGSDHIEVKPIDIDTVQDILDWIKRRSLQSF